MKKLTNMYVAGFVDGEGCISIFVHHKKGLKRPVHIPTLKVTNKRYSVLLAMQKKYGVGHVGPNGRSKNSPWNWTVKGQCAAKVLKVIYPHLRLKGRQAEIVLTLCELQKSWAQRHEHTIPDREYKTRLKLISKCKKLNRKGLDAAP